jgi:hypothetical protein
MDSKKRSAPQAGLRPPEQQALFLVPMQGSDCSLARCAPVLLGGVEAEGREPPVCS